MIQYALGMNKLNKSALMLLAASFFVIGGVKALSEKETSGKAFINGEIDLIKHMMRHINVTNMTYKEYLMLDLVKSTLNRPEDFPIEKYKDGLMAAINFPKIGKFYSFKLSETGVLPPDAYELVGQLSRKLNEISSIDDSIVLGFRERK